MRSGAKSKTKMTKDKIPSGAFTLELNVSVDSDPEPEWESPNGCKAIVAVAEDGSYIMLRKPNLWMFDCEPAPQDNGFGGSYDLPAGVYEITYGYTTHTDRESGIVDDWEFTPEEIKPLWEY